MWKVLIADDEAMERNALSALLQEKLGHIAEVRTAKDGPTAVEIATLWKAEIVLMDIEMPGMNGIEASQRIKHLLPKAVIVFLTAYGVFEYAQEAIRLGVTDYILKPAEDSIVLEALGRAINSLEKPSAVSESMITPPSAQPQDKNGKIMQQVKAYLEKNYKQDISLESLAQTLDFSPFYFSKLFKQYFGVTFVEYLTDIRINIAKEILQDTAKSAKIIGEQVGYPNPNYFVKLFKKKTGMTPTEYRNQL